MTEYITNDLLLDFFQTCRIHIKKRRQTKTRNQVVELLSVCQSIVYQQTLPPSPMKMIVWSVLRIEFK